MLQVTICAAVSSKYIVWQRANIEYLFVKQPKLGSVMAALIARCGPRCDATNIFMLSEIFRDVSTKIQCMTRRVERRRGAVVDIRLPPFISRCWHTHTLLITPDLTSDLGRMMVATGEVPDTYKKMLAQRDPGTQPQVGSYH